MTTRLSTASRDAMVAALTALFSAGAGPGVIQIRTGTQPATGETAASGTLLATVTLSDPAFAAPSTGVVSVDITPALTVAASATGTAGWYRGLDSNGNKIIDGSVTSTGGGGDLQLNDTGLVSTVDVTISSWTITQPGT